MNFTKCEHCNHKKVCKFIEPLRKLQLYMNDWVESYKADNIINIDIDCQGCENKVYTDKSVEPTGKIYGSSTTTDTESVFVKNVIY